MRAQELLTECIRGEQNLGVTAQELLTDRIWESEIYKKKIKVTAQELLTEHIRGEKNL